MSRDIVHTTLEDLFDGREQFTPPLVRAAMFEVARGIEGVVTVEQTTDPVGRSATALRWILQYEGPPATMQWYFDPESHQLMATTITSEGQVWSATIVTDAGIVGSTNDVPGPDQRFFPNADGAPDFEA
jgi:hypothetical protein